MKYTKQIKYNNNSNNKLLDTSHRLYNLSGIYNNICSKPKIKLITIMLSASFLNIVFASDFSKANNQSFTPTIHSIANNDTKNTNSAINSSTIVNKDFNAPNVTSVPNTSNLSNLISTTNFIIKKN